jgi:hypothetical protein
MNGSDSKSRPFLGIMFECCRVYSRIYRDADTSIYEGRCPKCLKKVKVAVDRTKGVASRFLKAR